MLYSLHHLLIPLHIHFIVVVFLEIYDDNDIIVGNIPIDYNQGTTLQLLQRDYNLYDFQRALNKPFK